jgi:hypothetical protein
MAIDGFANLQRKRSTDHAKGLAIAAASIAIAAVLEALLLIETARRARARALAIRDASSVVASEHGRPHRWWSAAIAILIGLLGFVLLEAFLVRLG